MSEKDETTKTNAQEIEIPKPNPNRDPYEYEFGPDFINLYVHEPFLGGICANVNRKEDWTVPTAYIGFNPKSLSIVMGYNPEFMAQLTEHQRKWVIKHEIYHLCLQHILGRSNTNRKKRQIFNVAADLAVNSLLGKEHMFEYALMPGMFPKNCKDQETGKLIENFKPLEATEFYMDSLEAFAKKRQKDNCPECQREKNEKNQQQSNKKDKQEKSDQKSDKQSNDQSDEKSDKQQADSNDSDKNHQHNSENKNDEYGDDQDQGDQHGHSHGNSQLCDDHSNEDDIEYEIGIGDSEGQSMDGHVGWGNVPEDVREIMNEKIKDMMAEGVKRAQAKGGWGSVPSTMQAFIEKLLTSEIDWKSILKHFIGISRSTERESTIKKINKKVPYVFPGIKRKTHAKIAFFIDNSGSMSDDDVQMALSAAFECSKETTIDVYNFDTEVDEASHQIWKRANNVKWQRTRCGGTDFNSVHKFVTDPKNKGKWNLVAIVTDGYAPTMEHMLKPRVIFLITENGTSEYVRAGDMLLRMKKDKTAHVKK